MKKFISIFIICLIGISLYPQVASFTVNTSVGCSPLTVKFNNTSSGAQKYFWDFGDGNTSIIANPTNVYSASGQYSVKLVITGTNGKKDSVIMNNLVQVITNPVADFSTSTTVACLNGNTFSFNNLSSNASLYVWDFGDGNTSVSQNPTHEYEAPGNFTIKLIAQNNFGCPSIKIKTKYVQVLPAPVASFTVSNNFACSPSVPFSFTNHSPGASSYQWNFGDGTSSAQANPTHIYSTSGTYNVSLIAINSAKCSDTVTVNKCITIFNNQTPLFTIDKQGGCEPLTILFKDKTPNASAWLWTFGDGTTSNKKNISHTYKTAGNYTPTLTVTNIGGCSYTTTLPQPINVIASPKASFTISSTGGCAPLNISCTNTSTNSTSWLWEFGDGATSTAKNPSHTYTVGGNYIIVLHAYNSSGCETIYKSPSFVKVSSYKADFIASVINGCAPLSTTFIDKSNGAVQWQWDFGDGSTSNLQNPSHNYITPGTYNVSLIGKNATGCLDTLVIKNYINSLNTSVNFTTPPPITGCIPLSVSFSESTIGAASWQWNFGDGTSSTQKNPVHIYTKAGTYIVSLTLTTSGGCQLTYNTFRIVKAEGISAPFTYTLGPCPGYTAYFNDTTKGTASWYWNFGDGKTSTIKSPTHTYSKPGNYPVSLTMVSPSGCKNTIVLNNTIVFLKCNSIKSGSVSAPPLQPPPDTTLLDTTYGGVITSTPTRTVAAVPKVVICAPLQTFFKNPFPTGISWRWNFGDGDTSNQSDPLHVYTQPGIYSVTLISQMSQGPIDTIVYPNCIKVIGTSAEFLMTGSKLCSNNSIAFKDSSLNATSWKWHFGDGDSASIQHPSHTYASGPLNYNIKLTTTNADGCSSSVSKTIYVNNKLSAWPSTYAGCINEPINFICNSFGYASYQWNFGDGDTSSSPNPSHSYRTDGSFIVTLKTTDSKGCVYLFSLPNQVTIDDPVADFNFKNTGSCNSFVISFTNLSKGVAQPLSKSCHWDFGDGSPIQLNANPVHTYTAAGTYSVTLSCYSNNNCVSVMTKTVNVISVSSNFSFTQNSTCLPISASFTDQSVNAVSWFWDFGDGSTSTQQNPVHTFTATPASDIILTVKNIIGCTDSLEKTNIKIFYSGAKASVSKGCAPLNVTFQDKSLNAVSWIWDFGDGDTSMQQNPMHIFKNAGTYQVMLIANAAGGCSDTTYLTPIQVSSPHAGFFSSTPVNCFPSVVSFTDTSSSGATKWLWDFGDGSSSVNKNPSHIYNIPGKYNIKLVVSNSTGCKDSVEKSNYVNIRGSIANFTVSAAKSCIGATTAFIDSSINASFWTWNFGDGETSTMQNPTHNYAQPGKYKISLQVSDSAGCISNIILPNAVRIYPTPVADFSVTSSSGCAPFSVAFVNNSTIGSNYAWDFGNGDTSTLMSPAITYSLSGKYTVSLVVKNSSGCSDTATTKINSKLKPVANFYSNVVAGCYPLRVFLYDSSYNTAGAKYLWRFGNGDTSVQKNPLAIYNHPGNYTVSLVVNNNTGCNDTVIKSGFITAHDRTPPKASAILAATVISDTSTYIVWTPTIFKDSSYYTVYRKDLSTGIFLQIGTTTIPSFTDNGVNTLHNSYCYKVQTTNSCGSSLPLDSLVAHCTINVTAMDTGKYIRVNWNEYKGATVKMYKVYRTERGQPPSIIAVVSPTVTSILDTTAYCTVEFSYRISATRLNGNAVASNSDTSIVKHMNSPLADQKVEIVRSTVYNNNSILTEWKAPTFAEKKVLSYNIYRSADNKNYSLLASVPSNAFAYIDNNVNVDSTNYHYKIEIVNSCDIKASTSNPGSSILLKANNNIDGQTILQWTAYNGWDTGVDFYIVEKMDEKGKWEVIKITDGNTLEASD